MPRLKAAGCDLVIVSCHSGRRPARPTATPCPSPRTPRPSWPRRSPGSTPCSSGTPTSRSPSDLVPSKVTPGKQVLLTEPLKWGMRLSVMDLDLELRQGPLAARQDAHSTLLNANTVPEDPAVADLRPRGPRRRAHLRQLGHRHLHAGHVGRDRPVRGHRSDRLHQPRPGRGGQGCPGRHPRRDPAGAVDRRAVQPRRRDPGRQRHGARRRGALHLRQHAARASGSPAPRSRPTSSTPPSTSSRSSAPGRSPRTPSPTRCDRCGTGTPIPDYNYDIMGGLDASLAYDIDIARPVGPAHHQPDLRRRSRSTRPRSSSSRSTTTGSPAVATSPA